MFTIAAFVAPAFLLSDKDSGGTADSGGADMVITLAYEGSDFCWKDVEEV